MRILVVEDEKKVAEFIKKGLEEEHYAVDTAYDGETGLYLAEVNEYDLIVLDLMIPKIDGWEVLKRIRKNKNKVPILILTARDTVEDIVRGLDSGCDDYLTKPFAFVEFLARVRALLRREKAEKEPVLHGGGSHSLSGHPPGHPGRKRDRTHQQRICSSRIHDAESQQGPHPVDDFRTCLGLPFRFDDQCDRCLCELSSKKD